MSFGVDYRRLTYAPKAFIYIRSSNLNGQIYDVSDDIVRGTVTEVCGDVSHAQFELRNRSRKWQWRADNDRRSIFLPNDLITIFLQRIPGKPIQKFTGYLDSVPYYQAYPGNALFTATCTLKKAAYSWFDPGLITFYQWLQKQGWVYDPSTMTATNPIMLARGIQSVGDFDAQAASRGVIDGGFAKLLAHFMTEIAGWNPDDVLISAIHKDIPQIAAALWSQIQDESIQQTQHLARFFQKVMGVSGWSSLSPQSGKPIESRNTSGNKTGNSSDQARLRKSITSGIAQVNGNISPLTLAMAAIIMTGMDETYSVEEKSGDANWGYGLYALRPHRVNPITGNPDANSIVREDKIDGYTFDQMTHAAIATAVFTKKLNAVAFATDGTPFPFVTAAKKNDLTSIEHWIQLAEGRTLPSHDINDVFNQAKQFVNISVLAAPMSGLSAVYTTDPSSMDWDSPGLQDLLTPQEKSVVAKFYKSKPAFLANLAWLAKSYSPDLRIAPPPANNGTPTNSVWIVGTDDDLDGFFASLLGNDSIDTAVYYTNDHVLRILQQGSPSSLGSVRDVSNTVGIALTMNKVPTDPGFGYTPTGPTASSAHATPDYAPVPSSINDPSTISLSEIATLSADAAFAASFSMPADLIASNIIYTGEKALMNDVSCLDAMKQFCQASLRTFRSLPDGRFLAFYPDYFGAYREPYWKITDLETINFGIQLSDEPLTTHVFVVGDGATLDGQIDNFDIATSRGVATIGMAAMLDSFINRLEDFTNSDGRLGRFGTFTAFLEHYGARKLDEIDQPLIRNVFYEFLYAWQIFMKKWSDQFATTVDVTFQPEVMAGGLVAFPDHDMQVYVEEVTHTFDYSAGFSTQMVVSAPAIYPASKRKQFKHHEMPGFALGGNTVSVGVGD